MKIYVLHVNHTYEFGEVLGVYAVESEAGQAYADACDSDDSGGYDEIEILEFDV